MNDIKYLIRYAVIGVAILGIILAAFNIAPSSKITFIDYRKQSDDKEEKR